MWYLSPAELQILQELQTFPRIPSNRMALPHVFSHSLSVHLYLSRSLVVLSSDRTQPSSASPGTPLQQQHLAFVSKCQVTVCISRRNCPIHFCSSCLSKPGNIDHSQSASYSQHSLYLFFLMAKYDPCSTNPTNHCCLGLK